MKIKCIFLFDGQSEKVFHLDVDSSITIKDFLKNNLSYFFSGIYWNEYIREEFEFEQSEEKNEIFKLCMKIRYYRVIPNEKEISKILKFIEFSPF